MISVMAAVLGRLAGSYLMQGAIRWLETLRHGWLVLGAAVVSFVAGSAGVFLFHWAFPRGTPEQYVLAVACWLGAMAAYWLVMLLLVQAGRLPGLIVRGVMWLFRKRPAPVVLVPATDADARAEKQAPFLERV